MDKLELLQKGPNDGVTGLTFLNNTLLASTSWDGQLRVHDGTELRVAHAFETEACPLLCLAASSSATNTEDHVLYAGNANGKVLSFRLSDSRVHTLGCHEQAVSCLGILGNDGETTTAVVSASWDAKLHIWSSSSESDDGKNKPLASVDLPGKAFSMDVHYDAEKQKNHVVLACAGRHIVVVEVNLSGESSSAAKIVLDRESMLKFQVRCIRFANNGQSLATGSIEGRVSIEYLEELGYSIPTGAKKYAFKCHRQGDKVYPVNCIAFYPSSSSSSSDVIFATGGCDGAVVTWDGLAKKKLTALHTFPTSIAALCFSPDGKKLAVASSYTFEDGEREHHQDEIYLRSMEDVEVQPKL